MKPAKKIAYVCADAGVPVFGCKGSSVHVQEMLGAFGRMGADIALFAMRFDGAAPGELAEVAVHALPQPPKGVDERERACLAANDDLRHALEGSHAASPFDLIYERYSLWSHAALDFAHNANLPYLLEVNAPLVMEQSEHRALIRRAEAERIAAHVFGQASGVLAVSEEVAQYVRGMGAPAQRVHVVPNGVNAQRFANILRKNPGAPFTVGFVGTLKPWHGLATLLEAFAQLHQAEPDVRLLIVGDGPERAALEADVLARNLLWPVKFAGAVPPASVPQLVGQFDVAVAPYTQTEGFYFSPLKVYEYMAAGLPVVVSRVGQLAQLVQHTENGLLCAPGNATELAETLLRLKHDAPLRHRLGQAAHATVVPGHTWDAVAEQILRIACGVA